MKYVHANKQQLLTFDEVDIMIYPGDFIFTKANGEWSPAKLSPVFAATAFEQGGIFIVAHLP